MRSFFDILYKFKYCLNFLCIVSILFTVLNKLLLEVLKIKQINYDC